MSSAPPQTFLADPTAPFAANFAFSTLILPAVSAGVVGQLAVDLLITNCSLARVGYLDCPDVVPVVGNDCFSETSAGVLHVAVEVFQDFKNAFTVVQVRSPVLGGLKGKLADQLIEWITKERFAQVFVLCGADAGRMTDKQLSSPGFRFVSTSAVTKEQKDLFARVQWTELEVEPTFDDGGKLTFKNVKLYNSGIPRRLLKRAERRNVTLTTLVMFTTEGNNTEAAVLMANALDMHLNMVQHTTRNVPGDWKQPYSWRQMFGLNHNQDLYS